MTACIFKALMCHDLWDADHCPRVEREPNWAPQPKLDASVKRVTSTSLAARGRPCRIAGDAHQATSDRTHWGTVIRSYQLPVLWHHAAAAHHWTGWRWSLPRHTSKAMNTNMLRSLCRFLAVMFGSVIQCWWMDWTLEWMSQSGCRHLCVGTCRHVERCRHLCRHLDVPTRADIWMLFGSWDVLTCVSTSKVPTPEKVPTPLRVDTCRHL